MAIAKNSRDDDSRIFPILIAELEGDTAKGARLRARAAEAFIKPGELDEALFTNIGVLPYEIGSRLRATLGKKYRSAHPSDWPARI